MIIYGIRNKHLRTRSFPLTTCPNCGKKEGISIAVFARYSDIFWIPFFPLGKTGVAVCKHCNHSMQKKEMPDALKREYNQLKSEVNTPLWQFSGLVIIALIIGFGIWTEEKEKEKSSLFIQNPVSGDVVKFKTESDFYSTMKIHEVSTDSVIYTINNFEVDKKSGIRDIDKDSNYSVDYYIISRQELIALHEEGAIFEVERN